MDRRQFIQGATLLALAPEMQKLHAQALPARPNWLEEFASPPDSARPWVYAFWMEGNVTREGISADLLAMKEAGIGGLLFMDGGLGNPPGPQRFMSASWLELFSFLVEEAGRLGLEINLNNAPGGRAAVVPGSSRNKQRKPLSSLKCWSKMLLNCKSHCRNQPAFGTTLPGYSGSCLSGFIQRNPAVLPHSWHRHDQILCGYRRFLWSRALAALHSYRYKLARSSSRTMYSSGVDARPHQ